MLDIRMEQSAKKLSSNPAEGKGPIRNRWPRIRKTAVKGMVKLLYVVDPRPYGKREYFDTQSDAKTRADQLEIERLNKGTESVEFPSDLRVMATEAAALLKPYGKTVRDAALHYATYLEAETKRLTLLTFGEYLDQWVDAKRKQTRPKKLRESTLGELEQRAKLFRSIWGELCPSEITKKDVEQFLDLYDDPQYQKNLNTKLGQAFSYCIKVLGLPIENPTVGIEFDIKQGEVEILEVTQCEHLLKCALESPHAEYVVPYTVIEMFAGLRPGEADQLRWENVLFDEKQIKVLARTTKVLETRYVPLKPTCLEWLKKFRREKGLIIGKNFRPKWNEVRAKAGYLLLENKEGEEWVSDVLRHCYGSYWLAIHMNRAELAENMGNSLETIKKHYRRAVPQATAKRFWALPPDHPTFKEGFSRLAKSRSVRVTK